MEVKAPKVEKAAVLNLLLDDAPFGVCLLNRKLRYVYVNHYLARINGASVEEHIGASLHDIVPALSMSLVPVIESVLASGIPVTFEIRRPADTAHSSELRDWLCCYFPARDRAGIIKGVAVTVSDVTELNEKERLLQLLSENLLDVVSLHKPGGEFMWVSPSCHAHLGYLPHELVGTDPYDLIHPDDRQRVKESADKQYAQNGHVSLQYRVVSKAGEIKWFEALSNPVLDHEGNLTSVQVCSRDVTDRVRNRIALKESEEMLRATIDDMSEGLILRAADGTVLLHNEAAERILGLEGTAISNTAGYYPNLNYIKEDGSPYVKEEYPFYLCLKTGEAQHNVEMKAMGRHGQIHWTAVNSMPLFHDGEQKPYAVVSTVRDITQQKIFEQEQAEQRTAAQMQMLSDRLIEVQEIERRKIAADLHDEIGGSLTGLKLFLESSKNADPATLCRRIEQATAIVQDTIAEVRQMSMDLRPTILDHSGLIPALEWYFKRYTSQTNIHINFRADKHLKRFKPEIEVTLYRIIQEALTNIARHARVDRAGVSVTKVGNVVKVSVRDHGVGFDLDSIKHRPDANGITGIRERLRLVDGRFGIRTSPGGGTRITAELPIDKELEAIS
jgi:PAS domain S-box-containing protein